MSKKKVPFYRRMWILVPLALMAFVILISGSLFRVMGDMIVVNDQPTPSDAAVVLSSGVEYYPRLIQAADLYRTGLAANVVINGNRKSDSLRDLEKMGFKRCCPWYSDAVGILTMLGVPEDKIILVSNEDAYDTVSEAEVVGRELIDRKLTTVIITTSKYHSRRAKFIWQEIYGQQLTIFMVSAETDPYDPNSWWKDGRQIRWVLTEYGSLVFYWWKKITGI
jgi:uncharacterized SAM-binding protein YcdF (DUF218 family)